MPQRVVDHGDLKKYRTEIPNIVFALGLSPYEFTLYCHLKRTAGADGICWKSTATLARETSMSSGMVSKAKIALQRVFPLIGLALITVSEELNPKGGKPKHCITLTDIWETNFKHKGTSSPREVDARPSSQSEVASSPHERSSSPHEIKKELREERTNEEVIRQRGTRLPDDFCLNSNMREWAAFNAPHVDLENALSEFRDYWIAVPGARGRKLDWNATFRNRLRDLEPRAARNGNGTYKPASGYQTAAERRSANFRGRLAVVEELRRESVGAVDEDVCGQSSLTRR